MYVHFTHPDYDIDEEPTTSTVPDEQRTREEDELQRVLALSLEDQGGYSSYAATSSAGPSGTARSAESSHRARAPAPEPMATAPQPQPQLEPEAPVIKRPAYVRALYDFAPDELGELEFKKGDTIRVLDSVYEQWWRGEVRQQVGIFPVNYVEAIEDPTEDLLREESELERLVFAQAADIHLLHARLQHLKPTDNFVDDDELQELYQRSLALRPKIMKLMDRYHTKVQELRSLNDKFVSARTTLDELIQGCLQRTEAPLMPPTDVPSAPSEPNVLLDTMPQEDEKRRLFERARAEVEAFQRQQQASSSHELEGLQWTPP